MSYTRSQRFEPGAFLRSCDICGVRFRSTELVRGEDGFWRCLRWCQETPAITRDKISAQSQQRREAPPPPHGIPFDQKDTYGEEARVFNFLCEQPINDASWPGGQRLGIPPANNVSAYSCAATSGVYSYAAAGETCRYLYDIITENKRPARWITVATAKLRQLADWLISKQNATGTADTNIALGGFDRAAIGVGSNTNYQCQDASQAGIGLLLAYQALGDTKYLGAARLVAHFIRGCQWSAYATFAFTSSDAAGTVRLYTGGHSEQLYNDTVNSRLVYSSQFFVFSIMAVEFLARLKAIDGDGTYGGLGVTGSQSFVTTGAAPLSSMIADALSFWATGTMDATTATVITGFSATTPRFFFNAFPATKPTGAALSAGTGSWAFRNGIASVGTSITGQSFAFALRSMFYLSGFSTQVASVWQWLMTFSINPDSVAAAGSLITDFAVTSTTKAASPPAPPAGQGNVVQPGYNPKLALAADLLVRDSANGLAPIALTGHDISAVGSVYDWSTTGLMAAIQSSQDAGSFRKSKDALTTGRLQNSASYLPSGEYPKEGYPMLVGFSGFGFQLGAQAAGLSWHADTAAMTAGVFRYQPQGWTGTGRPDKTQPGAAPGPQV